MSSSIYLILLLFFVVLNLNYCRGHGGELERQTLVISLDGFRFDYLDRLKEIKNEKNEKSNLWYLIDNGAYASRGIFSSFTTMTFPNHYTLATGLYQENHGVVSNIVYDPILNRTADLRNGDDEWVYGGEPIWTTLIKQTHGHEKDKVVGCSMWVGCQFGKFQNFVAYDEKKNWTTRIEKAIDWLKNDETKLVLLYYHEPDQTGHKFGTNSKQMNDTLSQIDKDIGILITRLEANGLDEVNLLIVSDHGMMDVLKKNAPVLPEKLPEGMFYLRSKEPTLWLVEPMPGRLKETIDYFQPFHHVKVIEKSDIPETWHYKNNRRVTSLVIVADPGYVLSGTALGNHGYDNERIEMRPTFIAHGPAFKSNSTVPREMGTVDVYLLLCTILDLKPAPNNGTASYFDGFLQPSYLMGGFLSTRRIPIVTLAVSISVIVFAMSIFLCHRQRVAARKKRIAKGQSTDKNGYLYKPLPLENVRPLLTTTGADLDDSDEFEDELFRTTRKS